MNMKKSIAGVMAGALAVSAIATTASAFSGNADQEQIVLSYDLNKEGKVWSDGSAVIKFTYNPRTDNPYVVTGLSSTNQTQMVKLGAQLNSYTSAYYALDTVTVTGTSIAQYDGTESKSSKTNVISKTFTRKNRVGEDGNNNVIFVSGLNVDRDTNGNIYAYNVPFTATGSNQDSFPMDGFVVGGTPAEDGEYKFEVTVVTGDNAAGTAYETKTITRTGTDKAALEKEWAEYLSNKADPYVAGTDPIYNTPGDPTSGVATAGTPSNADANLGKYVTLTDVVETKAPVAATKGDAYGFNAFEVVLTYTVNNNGWDGEWNYDPAWAVTNKSAGITGIGTANYDVNIVRGSESTYYTPMKTNWNQPAEVITLLKDLGYTYPQAVLNDVIANNENVAFTFTTCQHFVDTRQYVKPVEVNGSNYVITNPAGGSTTMKNLVAVSKGGETYVENPYLGVAYEGDKKNDFTGVDNSLWHNPVFTQALYQQFTWNGKNGYTASGPNGSQGAKDQFGSYASIWNTNLTSAGLVANSMWTMQLSDVDAFEWGDSTITFFWNAITDEANITNAANFLQSLQLYTPTEWYWDKLDVAVGAAIAEDVSADAPLEEEAEEVDEDPVEELIEADDDEEEDDFDFTDEDEDDFDFTDEDEDDFDFTGEEEEEEETPNEPAPVVVEVESPKTGNAPVALAVIPVALAAAAVVAKKRK